MAKLRKIQFYRNGQVNPIDEGGLIGQQNYNVTDLKSAYVYAEALFKQPGNYNDMLDGEILLYRFSYNSTVHTLVGVVHAGATKSLEVLANYDMLGAEISNEIAAAINKLDVDAFSLTKLEGTTLQGYQISEVDGKIVKGDSAETLLTFASAPTASNKVATQAEITALNADVTSTTGTNVQVQVVETAGVITSVTVSDNSVNAEDVTSAITTAIEGLDSEVENATGDIKVKVTQVNGELTAVNVTDTLATVAHSGKAADVAIVDEGNLYTAGNVEAALAEVMTKANALDAAQLSAGNGISITDKKINSDFTVTIENLPESEGVTAGTYIVIKGNGDNGQEITKVNANSFVKDGFLQKVELIEGTEEGEIENVLRFTWNSDAGIQVTNIPVSDLCDVYTADETYLHLNGFKFEHKTSGVTAGQYGADADATLETAGESITFNVPSITVDAAGHITVAEDKAIKVALPSSINTAVQTINGHAINDSFITTTVTPSDDNKTQTIAITAKIGSVANDTAGLAEATEVKDYVDSKIDALDESTTIVTNGVGIKVIDDGTGNDHKYTVSLAEAKAEVTNDTDDYVAANGTHTRISDITVDEYGRVTAVTKTTVTEDFDAGTY